MKYVIYGANRVTKDFLYVFDKLEILYIVEQNIEFDKFLGYPVCSLEYALADKSYDRIIICGFDKKEKEEVLASKGLEYGRGFVYEEDFFESLDELHIPKDRKAAVWGTGQNAKKLAEYNGEWSVMCYIDTYKPGGQFCGLPVLAPRDITDWKQYFVIISVVKDEEIRDFLCGKGLKEGEDFADFRAMTGMPSRMLKKTIFDRAYYDLECNTMLNHLEIFYRGNTRCCCTTFVEQDLGSIMDKDAEEIWTSSLHKILCLSTENRTYSFCDKTMCPLFVSKKAGQERVTENAYKTMTDMPKVLAVGYDSTCNLKCETCRKELYAARGYELEKLNRITEKIKSDYLPHCRFLILAGDGEVFASSVYRDIYGDENCNPDFIRLLSNGTLFTPDRWEKFIAGKKGKVMLTVSVDAATKETYEQIRCNGNFEKLQENMEFAARLRREGKLSYFRMNFVVQRKNYREMPLFAKWGEELGVDEVFFTKILNWGTYTEEEFKEVSMMEDDGVTPKAELMVVLESPEMKNSRIADLGTIQYSHKEDEIDTVENYYMWELEKRGGKIFEI